MSDTLQSSPKTKSLLSKTVHVWFGVVFIGQLIFAIYIFLQYTLNGILGNLDQWGDSSTGGYVPGEQMSNIAFGVHVILAGIVTLGGPLQLWPRVRNSFPRFHRINGRVYIGTAYLISIAGLYLIWGRGTVGDLTAHIMTSINGLIIMVAAAYTIRHAMAGQIAKHQQWAIRLFLAMSGVYFFRVFLNAWLITLQDTWIDFDSFTGTGLNIVGFCSYIAPQIVAELYFRIEKSDIAVAKKVMTGFLGILILLFVIGTVGASVFMWWPEMLR